MVVARVCLVVGYLGYIRFVYILFAVKVSAQELITCHQGDGCTGTMFEGVTVQDCCDNVNGGGQNGIGLGSSYQQDGVGGCTPCPIG